MSGTEFQQIACKRCGHLRLDHDIEPPYDCHNSVSGHNIVNGVEVEQDADCNCPSFEMTNPTQAAPKCPRCGSEDRNVRKEVFSDSSHYDFRECGDQWHAQAAVSAEETFKGMTLSEVVQKANDVAQGLRNQIGILKEQLSQVRQERETHLFMLEKCERDIKLALEDREDAEHQLTTAKKAIGILQKYSFHIQFCRWEKEAECECGYNQAKRSVEQALSQISTGVDKRAE